MKRTYIVILIVLTVLLVLFSLGCEKEESESAVETAVESVEEKTSEDLKPIGEIVDTDIIQNQEGNYQVPIPQDWFGKVSYTMDGTETTFYHITQDSNELEIYPVLLKIDTTADGEESKGDVFLEIGGIRYCSMPRFDFPYNENTPDALEFASLYESVPMILQSFWLIDDSAWQEEMPKEEPIAQTKPIGTVVDSTVIEAESKVYSVTVPEYWIRKTSYKKVDNLIIFYHITIDPSEMEIGPEIMRINLADGALKSSGKEVYTTGGYTFFYTPRFDFPYADNKSPDGKQFEKIYANASDVLRSCEPRNISVEHYGVNDVQFGGMHAYDDKASVLAVLGKPTSTEEVTYDAIGETYEYYTYDFGVITFESEKLVGATIEKDAFLGPRGVRIGMHMKDVISTFISETGVSVGSKVVYYKRNTGSSSPFLVSPYGVLYKRDEPLLELTYPTIMDMETDMDRLEESSMYEHKYTGLFWFDENGIMTKFGFRIGADAE